MSKILTPTDTITITIDNRLNPPQATMKLSRDLPAPWVAGVLSMLISQLMGEMMQRLSMGLSPLKPEAKPPDNPSGNGS